MPRYLVTLSVEEFVPESGKVTEVVYDKETETIIIEYEEEGCDLPGSARHSLSMRQMPTCISVTPPLGTAGGEEARCAAGAAVDGCDATTTPPVRHGGVPGAGGGSGGARRNDALSLRHVGRWGNE